MTDAYAKNSDPATLALSGLVPLLAEEAIFAAAAAPAAIRDTIDALLKRRAEVHAAAVSNSGPTPRLLGSFDAWVVGLSRSIAPIASPVFLPMADVLKHKVTLEVGARGIRSLFSSKPSDKDVQRVKRLGTLAVRGLRSVLASDGSVDADEQRSIGALVASLGLPETDARSLLDEAPLDVDRLDIYGELDVDVAKAILGGAWFAAAGDGLDPREEEIVRSLGFKLNRTTPEVEEARAVANDRVERGRLVGLATVEVVRSLLGDPASSDVADIAKAIATLTTPRRYLAEVLASAPASSAPLAKRYAKLEAHDRHSVLAVAWCSALHRDPTISRKAALRARFDRLASDIGEEGGKIRVAVEGPIDEAIATMAAGMR